MGADKSAAVIRTRLYPFPATPRLLAKGVQMYRALYRKYRPARFSDVCGQEHITVALKNQLKNGTVSHAYLFTGSRGTGKTSCAKILAKAVNCLSPENGDACCRCEACLLAESEENLDITEIDAASNNSVNDIRELRANVNFAPASSKYRVYIIDEVHMLSSGAFNALLKTIEEPPSHAIFILATTEVHKLPATIISRCQRYDFHRIDPEVIAARLKYVSEKEGITLSDSAAELISELCDGGMRDALSMLDLCAAYSDKVDDTVVQTACAIAGKERLFELCDGIADADAGTVLKVTDSLRKDGVDIKRLCSDLISHFRDLLVVKTVKDTKGLVVCTAADLEKFKKQAARFNTASIMLAIRVLGDALGRMTAANRRAELESALIKLCEPSLCEGLDALAARVENLECRTSFEKTRFAGISSTAETASTVSETAQKAAKAPMSDAAASVIETAASAQENGETAKTGQLPADDTLPADERAAEALSDQYMFDAADITDDDAPPEGAIGYYPDYPNPTDGRETKPVGSDTDTDKNTDADIDADHRKNGSVPTDNNAEEPEKVSTGRNAAASDAASAEARPLAEWSKVLRILGKECPLLVGYLGDSKAYISGDYLLIDYRNEQFLKLISQPLYRNQIKKAAADVTGKAFKLGPYKKSAEHGGGSSDKGDLLDVITGRLKDKGVPGKQQ